ncbi:MAG: hypothetical protein ABJA69_05305 [Acidobacteriaceae bacterium]
MLALIFFSVVPLEAQNIPRIDVFGGYSYLRFDSAPLGFTGRSNLNGWNASVSAPNIYRYLGITADASGHSGSELTVYNFLAGPQLSVNRGENRFYVHVLFGKTRERFALQGVSRPGFSTLARAYALGGGYDWNLNRRFDFRVIQADYIHASAFGSKQNNLRLSTGVVFKFGGK